MSVEHIGKGYVKICVSEEELENSIAGLSQLKPVLQGLEIRVRLRTYDGYRKHELVQLCRASGKER